MSQYPTISEDTKIFLIDCYNLATHFPIVKKDLIEPNNALHERLIHLSDAFLAHDLVDALGKIVDGEMDLTPEQAYTLMSQTLPLLAQISDVFYSVKWDVEELQRAQKYLFALSKTLTKNERRAAARELFCKEQSESAPEPTPEEKSTVDFVRTKVSLLSKKEYEQFMNTKPGKRLPDFVKQWKKEMQQMQYFVSDKTFYNALYTVRKSPSPEIERSQKRK